MDRPFDERTPSVASGRRAAQFEPEIIDAAQSTVGRASVRRALPRRQRRHVGAWCFADHMGPLEVTERAGLDIGPHPHTGLETVTWLTRGELLHRDSVGSEQVIRRGQVNLMSAGRGIAHSEESTGRYRGELEGIQLWIAQPEHTRHDAPAFTHVSEPPRYELAHATATILIGSFADVASVVVPATPLLGAQLEVRGVTLLPLQRTFEHGLIVLEGALDVNGVLVTPGHLAYLAPGAEELTLRATSPAIVMLLGGEPFTEPLLMWWNFVARSRDEIDAAYRSWHRDDGRFGTFTDPLDRIDAPVPSWRARSAGETASR